MMNKIPLLGFLVLLAIGCHRAELQRDDQLKSIISKAKEVDDFETCISATWELISADTNELNYYDSLAVYFYRAGKYNSALKTSKRCLSYRTLEPTLRVALESSVALNDLEGVVKYADGMVQLKPDNLKYRYDLAKAHFNMNNAYAAQQVLRDITRIEQSKVEATESLINGVKYRVSYYAASCNLLGIIQANAGRNKDAIELFQESLKFAPDFPLPAQNIELLSQK